MAAATAAEETITKPEFKIPSQFCGGILFILQACREVGERGRRLGSKSQRACQEAIPVCPYYFLSSQTPLKLPKEWRKQLCLIGQN